MSRQNNIGTVGPRPKKLFRMLVPAIGVLVLIPLAGCGFFADAGPKTTEQRSIAGITAVRLMTSGDLTVTTGETPTLTITAGANQLPELTSEIQDGTLILDNTSDLPRGAEISYALTVPSLRSLELSGSGSAHGTDVLTGDAVVASSGSGDVQLSRIAVPSIAIDLSGSGAVEITGSATTQHVTASGSGDYNGAGLTTEDTDVDVSGSGTARVNVSGRLTAEASGSGSITYTGNPATVRTTSTGSGSIGQE